jgi:hypothetical protein
MVHSRSLLFFFECYLIGGQESGELVPKSQAANSEAFVSNMKVLIIDCKLLIFLGLELKETPNDEISIISTFLLDGGALRFNSTSPEIELLASALSLTTGQTMKLANSA